MELHIFVNGAMRGCEWLCIGGRSFYCTGCTLVGSNFVPTTAYFALINRWQTSGTGKKLFLEMSAVRRDNDNDNDKTFDGEKAHFG